MLKAGVMTDCLNSGAQLLLCQPMLHTVQNHRKEGVLSNIYQLFISVKGWKWYVGG